jgi:GT2 family glycosyltransferase
VTFRFLVAVHNRRATTLRCLESLRVAVEQAGVTIHVYLFDDGSTDGTADAVLERYPDTTVLYGDGNNYWAASMAQVEQRAAMEADPADVLVWLNDDVVLDPDALARVAEAHVSNPSRVLVFTVRDPDSDQPTYGGFVRSRHPHPLRFRLMEPDAERLVPLETFNGNLVVVPKQVLVELGGIDGGFPHAWGDIDFGLRLTRANQPALLAPGTYGTCPRNPPAPRASPLVEWRRFRDVKGEGNFASHRRLLSRVIGRRWPWPIAASYLVWWLRRIPRIMTMKRS